MDKKGLEFRNGRSAGKPDSPDRIHDEVVRLHPSGNVEVPTIEEMFGES